MNDKLPTAVWSGSFNLFGVSVNCHVLDDGRRIIDADSFREMLDAMHSGNVPQEESLMEFAKWLKGIKS